MRFSLPLLRHYVRTYPRRSLALVGTLIAALALFLYLYNPEKSQFVTAEVEKRDIEQVVSASGTLNPVKLINVGTQISGVVQSIHVDFNQHVEKDQILAELDPALVKADLIQSQATLAKATAALTLAKTDYARAKALFTEGYIPKADLDKAQQELTNATSDVKNAQAEVDRDKVRLGYSVIRSPVSGVIISRDVDVGQTVAASFQTPTLFKIAQDLKKMQIDTNLSEADVGAIKAGIEVRFTVDAFPDRRFTGMVRQIRLNPSTVQNVVTYNVVIDVENLDSSLLPGMTAFVTLIVAEHKDVLGVPNAALNFRPAESKSPSRKKAVPDNVDKTLRGSLYILRDGRAERVKVNPGISDGKWTEILEGALKEGDLVITEEQLPASEKKRSGASPKRIRTF